MMLETLELSWEAAGKVRIITAGEADRIMAL